MGCIHSTEKESVEARTFSCPHHHQKFQNDTVGGTENSLKYTKENVSKNNQQKANNNRNTSKNLWVNSSYESSGPGKMFLKTRFPLWKKYEQCTLCMPERRRSASDDDFLKITLQRPGKDLLCKKCSKDQIVSNPNNSRRSHGINDLNIASFAGLLAMTALDLTAPASDAILKNRKNSWIQLAGHPGSFAPAGPNTIWKKRIAKENYETKAYQALMDDPITEPIIPCFTREVEYNGEFFIEIEDLLHHFNDPNIMDVKMGKRTFLESEVKNPVLRKDLYEKMTKLDPNAPTTAEHEQGAITKLRYMQFRECESSTTEYGYRLEAIRMRGEEPNTNLKKVKTKEQVKNKVLEFVDASPGVLKAMFERLKDIRDRVEQSSFFKSHEVIGSSLLFMYDQEGHSGVWLIDFAKTIPVEAKLTLNHRSTWQLGNHEDGILSGLDNIIEVFAELVESDSSSGDLNSLQT